MTSDLYVYTSYTGPYLGILRPWAQESFVPPLICSYSVMCKQKQHKKNWQKTKHYSVLVAS
jgi:hypothetical protein